MTEQEVRALLAIVVAYDNRRPTTANITAWHEQAERNRWGFDEAREAIHRHFAESTEFLMPAHVTAVIRAQRRLPGRYEPLAIDRGRSRPERVRDLMAQLAEQFGWRQGAAGQRHDNPALAIECPHCHAAAERPCTRLVTRGVHRGERHPLGEPHPSRTEAAASPSGLAAAGRSGGSGSGRASEGYNGAQRENDGGANSSTDAP